MHICMQTQHHSRDSDLRVKSLALLGSRSRQVDLQNSILADRFIEPLTKRRGRRH